MSNSIVSLIFLTQAFYIFIKIYVDCTHNFSIFIYFLTHFLDIFIDIFLFINAFFFYDFTQFFITQHKFLVLAQVFWINRLHIFIMKITKNSHENPRLRNSMGITKYRETHQISNGYEADTYSDISDRCCKCKMSNLSFPVEYTYVFAWIEICEKSGMTFR